MSVTTTTPGIPPVEITSTLRIEGLAVLALALIAYQALNGNWWVFAALILAPDLSMFGLFLRERTGARIYNLIHTYTLPALLGGIAWLTGAMWLLPFALIWVAHIGMDRAVGYGLKYPGNFRHTHLGVMGKLKRETTVLADAR